MFAEEGGDLLQCERAYMVLGPLCVNFGDLGWDAKENKKIDQYLVSLFGVQGKLSTLFGKGNRFLLSRFYKTLLLQPSQGTERSYMRNSKMPRNFSGASLAFAFNQVVNKFGIIFGSLVMVMQARLMKSLGAKAHKSLNKDAPVDK